MAYTVATGMAGSIYNGLMNANWYLEYVMNELKELLHDAVFRCGRPAKVIADEVGVKYNYLARMCLSGDAGANFPAKLLAPIMNATKDFRPLKYLANRCGFLLVELSTCKHPEGDVFPAYLQSHAAVLSGLYNNDALICRRKILDALLTRHLETTERLRMQLQTEGNLKNGKSMSGMQHCYGRKRAVEQ